MNTTIANSLGEYFETLYLLNQNLITFCGTGGIVADHWTYQKYIRNVITAIPQLIPYSKRGAKYVIVATDGLLEYSDEINFLEHDYCSILQNHYEFLVNLKEVRNKFEHKMHSVFLSQTDGGSSILFGLHYLVKKQGEFKETVLWANQFISLAKDINSLFAKIQQLISEYAFKEGKDHYAYYQRLLRYDFTDFNKIYDSKLLQIIGKAFLPF